MNKKIWKNWPYWLKGGVVGGIILTLSSISSLGCLYFFTSSSSLGFECLPFALPMMLLPIPITAENLSSLESFLIGLLFYFITGAIIGGIVDLIKKRPVETGLDEDNKN